VADVRNIKNNQYDFPTTNPISEEAQDLITSLLCPDPTNRPSIDEISDHKFFHSGELPREIPQSTLHIPPTWDTISKTMSELNWRYISVQAGLGKNIKVGQDAGKSLQACIASNENPLKGHVARLQQEERGILANGKETNVLPMTLSPRVPAPAVGGLTEGRLMAKGAKRRAVSEEDKENDVPTIAGSLKRKATAGKKRGAIQQAFPDIPEEANDHFGEVQPRRMAPPARKPSGTIIPTASTKSAPVVSLPTLSRRTAQRDAEQVPTEAIASGAKRSLRGTKALELPATLPSQAELNVLSRVPPQIQAQRATLKRTITQDNLKEVTPCI
jgi:serine/threonine protein kinase